MATAVLALVGVGAVAPAPAAEPYRGGAGPGVTVLGAPPTVGRFERFTVTARITPTPANPFDPDQIDARVVFTGPAGARASVIAFFTRDYGRRLVDGHEVLSPRGEAHWEARFSPPVVGRWRWWWQVRTPSGTARTTPRQLLVHHGAARGFIRRSPRDARYLAHDDGSPYFAIGENLGWYDARGTYAYDDWLRQLERQRATYARLWMPSWAFGIEWKDTGLGNYGARLDRAWQLDRVLDEADHRGIAVMLSLQNHGAFSTAFNSEWTDNPYNAANGGPLRQPGAFFTDPEAKRLFRQRLRYIVARWGASTNLLAWELWNEADLTDTYDTATSVAWHREMADYLRSIDPARHLVTTSFAFFFNDPAVWSGAGLDATQLHFYSKSGSLQILPDLATNVATWQPDRVRTYGLPVLFAELGVASDGPAETKAADPQGIGVHDGLWAGVLAEGFGTAMTWWWDNLIAVEPHRYYPMFGSVAGFLHDVAWDREHFVAATVDAATSGARPLVAHELVGTKTAFVWLKDGAYQWTSPEKATIADARVPLDALTPGSWCGAWWDTWRGRSMGGLRVRGGPGASARAPSFEGDVALRLARC